MSTTGACCAPCVLRFEVRELIHVKNSDVKGRSDFGRAEDIVRVLVREVRVTVKLNQLSLQREAKYEGSKP